jgi:hypothetical protein
MFAAETALTRASLCASIATEIAGSNGIAVAEKPAPFAPSGQADCELYV